jgi:hypothetical protein
MIAPLRDATGPGLPAESELLLGAYYFSARGLVARLAGALERPVHDPLFAELARAGAAAVAAGIAEQPAHRARIGELIGRIGEEQRRRRAAQRCLPL